MATLHPKELKVWGKDRQRPSRLLGNTALAEVAEESWNRDPLEGGDVMTRRLCSGSALFLTTQPHNWEICRCRMEDVVLQLCLFKIHFSSHRKSRLLGPQLIVFSLGNHCFLSSFNSIYWWLWQSDSPDISKAAYNEETAERLIL